jgi:hypothetical protein
MNQILLSVIVQGYNVTAGLISTVPIAELRYGLVAEITNTMH